MPQLSIWHTDKKENQIFSSYIRKFRLGQLQSHGWGRASISSYIRKRFLIYDFVTAPFWISLYMRKIIFSFLSVQSQFWVILQAIGSTVPIPLVKKYKKEELQNTQWWMIFGSRRGRSRITVFCEQVAGGGGGAGGISGSVPAPAPPSLLLSVHIPPPSHPLSAPPPPPPSPGKAMW